MKSSEHHTSIQWHADSMGECTEFRRLDAAPDGRSIHASCPRLPASIDAAVHEAT